MKKKNDERLFLSSKDLTSVPVYPIQQALCAAAALGITHSERNGHHYIRGFSYMSEKEIENALREFPSLYSSLEQELPTLNIQSGKINLEDVNKHGLGVLSEPDWDALELLELSENGCDNYLLKKLLDVKSCFIISLCLSVSDILTKGEGYDRK